MTRAVRFRPDYRIEDEVGRTHGGRVAGIDEAGRGPWAGPVVAAAVILRPGNIPTGLADSKLLHADERERLFELIVAQAEVGIGIVDEAQIDRDNILAATLSAMQMAVAKLPAAPLVAIVDGNRAPALECHTQTVVKGDAISVSIAAASIVAKVTRDRLMTALEYRWPGYGFARHKGYGTPQHRAALAALGVTPHHRRSFAPVREALERYGACKTVMPE